MTQSGRSLWLALAATGLTLLAIGWNTIYQVAITHSSAAFVTYWEGGLAETLVPLSVVTVVAALVSRRWPRAGMWVGLASVAGFTLAMLATLLSYPTLGLTFIPSSVLGWLSWRAMRTGRIPG